MGRLDRTVVFVPLTAPGDVIEVEIVERRKNYSVGRMVRLLTPAPSRTEAPCPVFGRCGGCVWQHVDYDEQLRQKQNILTAGFRKIAVGNIAPIQAAPSPYRYRNRIQLHCQGRDAGYFQAGSHTLVPIDDCLLAEAAVARQIPAVRTSPPGKWEITRTEDNQVHVTRAEAHPTLARFSQVNAAQNTQLLNAVLQAVEGEPKQIWDLYCGSGNITKPLAARFTKARVTGVELSKANLERAPTHPPIRWLRADVLSFLKSAQGMPDTLVVVDPPRAGLDAAVVAELLRVRPRQILYVSCDVMTLARDCQALSKEFAVARLQGFDMFPQTAHLEALAVLKAIACDKHL